MVALLSALSIKAKLVGLVVGSAIVTIICTVVVLFYIRNEQEAQIQRDDTAVAEIYGGLVQEYLDDVLGTLQTIAAAPAIRAPLELDQMRPELRGIPEGADPGRRTILRGEFNALPRFEAVLMITPQRDIYLAEPFGAQLAFAGPSLAGAEVVERALNTGQVSWGRVQTSHVTGKPVLVLQVPVKDDSGAVVSLVANAVRLDALADMAKRVQLGENSSVMLFDNAGVPIVYPDAERIAALQPLTEFPLVANALAGRSGSYLYHNPMTDRDEIGVIVPVENGSFYVAVTKPQAEAFGAINRLMTTLLLVLGAAGALILTAGLLFARSLARGLGIVERAAIGLAAGDLDQKVDIRSTDELGRMASAFRGMMAYQSHMANVADAVAGGDLAQDVHPQSSRDRLGFALESMVANLRKLVARLEDLAFHDALTGLPNRALFLDSLQTSLKRARNEGSYVALLFLDLDDFKTVNDTLGHEIGDQVLITVAERLRGCVRETDMICRLGGDEFTILMDGRVDTEVARRVALQVTDTLAQPIHLGEHTLAVSCSVGIALGPGTYQAPADLLRAADSALYTAKQRGKAQVAMLEPGRDPASQARLEEDGPRAA